MERVATVRYMHEPYNYSATMRSVWNEVVTAPVQSDPRSSQPNGSLFGYDFNTVRIQILEHGRADFGSGYKGPSGYLTADDKALLYAFINAKAHHFACRKLLESAPPLATVFAKHPTIIDIGCGPATAALAVAECYLGSCASYIGVDSAPAMLRLADRLMRAASVRGLVATGNVYRWQPRWDDLMVDQTEHVVLICSYLCASSSVDVGALSRLIMQLRDSRSTGTMWMLYLNSVDRRARERYDELRVSLGWTREPSQWTVSYVGSNRPIEFLADAFEVSPT